jgi:hypothetical protein
VVGVAVKVTVGAGVTGADCNVEPPTEVTAGVTPAVPACAMFMEVVDSGAQAASEEIAANPRTQCAIRGASPAINSAWRLTDIIKDPLISTGAFRSEAEGWLATVPNAGGFS